MNKKAEHLSIKETLMKGFVLLGQGFKSLGEGMSHLSLFPKTNYYHLDMTEFRNRFERDKKSLEEDAKKIQEDWKKIVDF